MAILALAPFDPYAALRSLMQNRTDAGALASFVGLVRGSASGVTALRLDHYPVFTERALNQIETDGRARFEVLDTLVMHRAGIVALGEPIVLVAAISAHRKTALAYVDYLMDRLKTEAPFWKKELGPTKNHWVEPRKEDYQARDNWEN